MEACVGIKRTDDFLQESMTEPIRIGYEIMNIQRVGPHSVSVCETSRRFTVTVMTKS